MQFFEIVLIGMGLAMDAVATSICKGLTMKALPLKNAFIIALYFGFFQALMPVIGFHLGNTFLEFVEKIDHWIAFALLVGIGINMIKESKQVENINTQIDFKTMIILAIVTSIDALACRNYFFVF